MKRALTKSALSLAFASLLALPAGASVKKDSLIMYCSTNQNWNGEAYQGFYYYPFTGNGKDRRVGTTLGMTAYWGAPVGNKYYLFCGKTDEDSWGDETTTYYLVTLDRATLEEIDRHEVSTDLIANDVAVDPTSGRIYGLFIGDNGEGYVWGYVDPETRTRTKISDYTVKYNNSSNTIDQFRSICFSPDGQAYAVPFSGKLYKVDKETGEVTNVGFTKYYFNYVESATWDHVNDRVLTTYSYGSQSVLNAIDPTTAAMTTVGNLPGAVTVIYNPYDYVSEKSPLPVDNLTATFENGARDGVVSFVAPTLAEDSTSLSGDLNYFIVNKGEVVASGTVAPGGTVSEQVNTGANELVKYSVYTTNASGESIRELTAAFAGIDKPAMPVVSATLDDNKVKLVWNPVKTGAQGGYIDQSKLTYDVKRYPGGKTVASAITDTTFTDEITLPEEGKVESISYKVVARSGGKASEEGASKKVMIGHLIPEWTEQFATKNSLDNFTIIGTGEKAYTWEWNDYRKCANIKGDKSAAQNDWLISPPVYLKKGLSYNLSFDYNTGSYYNQKYELCIGKDNTAEAMTKQVDSETLKYAGKPYGYSNKTVTVRVDEDGIYYLGWHARSSANDENLYIDNIDLQAGVVPDVPGNIDNFKVVPEEYGRLYSNISFTLPTKTLNDKAITETLTASLYRNGEVVKTVDNLNAGTDVNLKDTVTKAGDYNYQLIVSNTQGNSNAATADVFVGNNAPLGAYRPTATEDLSTPGMVTLKWKSTETDYNGRKILPETLGYKIVRLYSDGATDTLATVRDTVYTYKECEPTTSQYMVYYLLYAFNDYGMSNAASLPSLALSVGEAYPAPYNESFKGRMKIPMDTHTLNGWSRNVKWEPVNDGDVTSQDGDGCYAHMIGEAAGNSAALTTGKISLEGLSNAELSFWVYRPDGSEANQLETKIGYNGVFTSMDITTMDQLQEGWNKTTIDLSDYAGKTIVLQWVGTIQDFVQIMMDNIYVGDPTVDLIHNANADEVQSVRYYDLSGREIQKPAHGAIVLMKTIMGNGKTDVRKVIFK